VTLCDGTDRALAAFSNGVVTGSVMTASFVHQL
jgi:hypothetical protein